MFEGRASPLPVIEVTMEQHSPNPANGKELVDSKDFVPNPGLKTESLNSPCEDPVLSVLEGEEFLWDIKDDHYASDGSSTVSGPWPSDSEEDDSNFVDGDNFTVLVKEKGISESSLQTFLCIVCGQEFASQSDLELHTKTHVVEPPQRPQPQHASQNSCREQPFSQQGLEAKNCAICEITFMFPCQLKAHNEEVHACEKNHKCITCGRGFLKFYNLIKHRYEHLKKKALQNANKCALCPKSFITVFELQRHMDSHIGKTPYVCLVCGEGFTTQSLLDLHPYGQKDEKPFKCLVCSEVFPNSYHLKRHSYVHTGKMPYTCPECGQGFWRKMDLDKHQNIHSKHRKSPSRRQHEFGHSGSTQLPNIKSYPCNVCDETFPSKYQRIKHDCPFSFQTPHVCAECGVRFTIESDLKEHIKGHRAGGSYPCLCCDQVFEYPKDLNEHVCITHICYKRYTCSMCGTGFRSKSSFEIHLARHEFGDCYECVQCNMVFLSAHERNKHSEIHAGQNMHVCQFCGAGFNSPRELQAHNYTEKIPYRCAICGQELLGLDAVSGHNCDRLKCVMCAKYFPTISKLNMHRTGCHIHFFPGKRKSPSSMHVQENEHKPDSSKLHESFVTNGDDGLFVCMLCKQSLPTSSELLRHMSDHREGDSFKCLICDKKFLQSDMLQRHIHSHKQKKKLSCSKCRKEFLTKFDYHKHTKMYNCQYCQQESNCRSQVIAHKAQTQKCPKCERKFCTEKDLENHIYGFPCSVCGKMFCSKVKLEWHFKRQHSKDRSQDTLCKSIHMTVQEGAEHKCTIVVQKALKCFACGLGLHFGSLKSHIHKTHTCHKRLECCLCGKGFRTKHQHRLHTNQHATVQNSKCISCDKKFCSSEELEKHMDVHAGSAPHVCPVCGEGFSSWSDLQNHNYTETDKMPHGCTECGQRFWLFKDLMKHSDTHKRYLKNRCSLCHVNYFRYFTPNVKRNASVDIVCESCIRLVRKNKVDLVQLASSNCELCVKGFTQEGDLRDHLLTYKHAM